MEYRPVTANWRDPYTRATLLLEKGSCFKVFDDDQYLPSVSYIVKSQLEEDGFAYHRVDGPARVYSYGYISFWVNGVGRFFNTTEYCKAAGMSDEETFMWVLRFGDELPHNCEGFYGKSWAQLSFEEI